MLFVCCVSGDSLFSLVVAAHALALQLSLPFILSFGFAACLASQNGNIIFGHTSNPTTRPAPSTHHQHLISLYIIGHLQ
jgi:hypothetical protein